MEDGKDGQTLIHRTLLARAWGPKNKQKKQVTSSTIIFCSFSLLKVDLVPQQTFLNHKGNMNDMAIRKINITCLFKTDQSLCANYNQNLNFKPYTSTTQCG